MTKLKTTNTRYTRYGTVRDKFIDLLMNYKESTITRENLHSLVYAAGGTYRTANGYNDILSRTNLLKNVGYGLWELPKNRSTLRKFNTSNKNS